MGIGLHLTAQGDGTGVLSPEDWQSGATAYATAGQGRHTDGAWNQEQGHSGTQDEQQRLRADYQSYQRETIHNTSIAIREWSSPEPLQQAVVQLPERLEAQDTIRVASSDHAECRSVGSTHVDRVT